MIEQIEICVNEIRAMLYLPENAVEAVITCKIFQNGELVTASKTMSMSELRKAFEDAERNYMEDTDTFELTEQGRAYLESLKEKQNEQYE